jgi:formylglycine-generating enzyme required for sulfatase activity
VLEEQALRGGQEFQECARCPSMVVMPAGEFWRQDANGKQKVTIAQPFAVSKTEITFHQWKACVALRACSDESDQGWGRETRPIINVTWDDAKKYVAWISQETGRQYRLLSEAEWEYAARAGSETLYSWGNEVQKDGKVMAKCRDCAGQWDEKTAPVQSFPANAFGLYDMYGNVWEWLEDCWHDSYRDAPTNGAAWVNEGCSHRVLRGGSWKTDRSKLGPAGRYDAYAPDRDSDVGIRLGRTISVNSRAAARTH